MIKRILLGLAITFFAGTAFADTVNIRSAIYQVAGGPINYMGPCATPGLCQNFEAAQFFSGTFTTSSPLPKDAQGSDIVASVTSYSFSNGLDDIKSADPSARLSHLFVWTDASGNVIHTALEAHVWLDDFRFSFSRTSQFGSGDAYSVHNGKCSEPGSTLNSCKDGRIEIEPSSTSQAYGYNLQYETIASAVTSPHPVPTLSGWGLVIMAILLGLFGVFYLPKMKKPVNC